VTDLDDMFSYQVRAYNSLLFEFVERSVHGGGGNLFFSFSFPEGKYLEIHTPLAQVGL
jgi:hypothetical protein